MAAGINSVFLDDIPELGGSTYSPSHRFTGATEVRPLQEFKTQTLRGHSATGCLPAWPTHLLLG
jgi:hypothetical protein